MKKYTQREWDRLVGIGVVPTQYAAIPSQSLPDGPVLDSTGSRVSEQTTRQSQSRQGSDNATEEAKP